MRLKTMWIKLMLVPVVLLLSIEHLEAHEPLFVLGPHTIYQNGVGLESELEKGEAWVGKSFGIIIWDNPGLGADFCRTVFVRQWQPC